MLEGFTEPAKKGIIGALQEAHLLGHKYIGIEHILLALISDAGGLAAKALQSANLDLNVIREQAEKIFGRGGGSSRSSSMELLFTYGAQLVLKPKQEEAQRPGHSLAEERELLPGLLKGCDAEITGLLQNQGVDVNNIRDQVSRCMEGEKEKASSANDQCAQGGCNENSQKPIPSNFPVIILRSISFIASFNSFFVQIFFFKYSFALRFRADLSPNLSFIASKSTNNMEPNVVPKPPNIMIKPLDECKMKISDMDLINDMKKINYSDYLSSPSSPSGISKISSNGKWSCLCSPTNHAGSFRCRYHRASSALVRGKSVGSNLNELASKSGGLNDGL